MNEHYNAGKNNDRPRAWLKALARRRRKLSPLQLAWMAETATEQQIRTANARWETEHRRVAA